jgi:hypothetical protein
MAAGFNNITDLYDVYYTVQNTMIRTPKDAFISSLREFFARDSKYHYVRNEWGYPKTPDHTDLDPEAGLYDDLTTRVFIGEQNRYDIIYYPAILVKSGSFRYVPISLNRNKYFTEWIQQEVIDGYGNRTFMSVPDKFVLAGAWEGSISVEVLSKGLRERDDLIELIAMLFVDFNWSNLSRMGVSIKPDLTISNPSEEEDRNDKLFRQSVDVNIRGEWRREIPINNIIDTITFCVEFGSINPPGPSALNLEVRGISELSFPETNLGV